MNLLLRIVICLVRSPDAALRRGAAHLDGTVYGGELLLIAIITSFD